jgi:MSHA biogenesis protein MshI
VFSLLKKAHQAGVRAGIAMSADAAAIVRVRRKGVSRPCIEQCERVALRNEEPLDLSALVAADAARVKICVALHADTYQLVQVEAPEVLPAELRAAVRWRLRDVINFNLDDAVVDVFEIPDQSRRAQKKMMFAVAARTAAVQSVVQGLSRQVRSLDAIDTPELCLRNVSALLPQDQKGVALLALSEGSAQLIVTRQGVMYLTRRIDLSRRFQQRADDAPYDIDAESVALELQRSLDYYESNFDQAPIGDLVIAPTGERARDLARNLRDQSSLRIGLLALEEVLDVAPGVNAELDWLQLVALGAALRTDTIEL